MTPEQIEQVLAAHLPSKAVSGCACGARRLARPLPDPGEFEAAWAAHVAQALVSLMPQATERVEYRVVTTNDMPDGSDRFLRNERRTVVSYAPVVGEWEVCDE